MRRGLVELIVFSLSLLIILATLGFLIYDGLIKPTKPATVVIDLKVDEIRKTPTGFKMPLTLRNIGDEAAQQVTIEVVARSKTDKVEVSQVMVPFLPEGSTRDAVVLFSEDPRKGTIEARAASYGLP